ncbi:MAG: hypothetical protein KDD49_09220, partial [Bacteroidetes bacterium]|nr:hypothetical protein [Bacteroidota bacterium]
LDRRRQIDKGQSLNVFRHTFSESKVFSTSFTPKINRFLKKYISSKKERKTQYFLCIFVR